TTGEAVEAAVENGAYAAVLNEQYSYDVTLKNADGYVVTSEDTLELAKNAGGEEHYLQFDVSVEAVKLVTVSGSLTGISADAASKLTISLAADQIFVPSVVISGTEYTVQVEAGVEYAVSIAGAEDYELVSPAKVCVTKDTAMDIEIAAKPVYKVTINPQGASTADLADAVFTFTRHSDADVTVEEDYVYSFIGTDSIALRDGVYTVKVENSGAYVQKLTSNLKVDGADVTKTISFSSNITEWVFTDTGFTGGGYTSTAQKYSYNGLEFVGGKSHGNTYLYMGPGTVSVPVSGDCTITVNSCYQYSFYFENENESSVGVKTGSTGQIDSYTFDYYGAAGMVDITFLGTSYVNSIKVTTKSEYKDTLTVGSEGCDYTTINDALDAVRAMDRTADQRVTIKINPGNYEEMLVIDVPNVSLVNAAGAAASIETTNKGVDIAENAVRITSYYGHGYTYYSMGSDCKYSDEILAVNKENGYASFENPGSGTTAGSYWNATVVITASGFEAEGIIFENSFNQYVSEKAANDVIVAQSSAKEGSVARADMAAGDTTVQNKKYVERAAALAIANNCTEVSFDNCKFIGRQDTLYGGTGVTAAFYDCAVYGGTDFIFGGMTAVFAKCDLVMNTMEDSNDVAYITAAQQKSGRGYLMYNCNIVSTTPGVDTASETVSKPGYLGRPWQATTSEVVFYATIIGKANDGTSLVTPAGWASTLSGTSDNVFEFGTYEKSGVDNTASRVSWANVSKELTGAVLSDGTAVSVKAFLGSWDAFAGKDMTIEYPEGGENETEDETETETETETDTEDTVSEYVLDASTLTSFGAGAKADGEEEKAGTDNYFTIIYSAKSKVDSSSKVFDDGFTSSQRINLGGKMTTEKNSVKFTTENPATVTIWWVEGGDDNRQMAILNAAGEQVAITDETLAKNAVCISKLELAEAGTYYLGGATNNNYIFKVVVSEQVPAEPFTMTLDTANDLTSFAAGDKADGEEEKAGTEDYFTVIYSAKSKVDSSSKVFDDGYTSSQRLNLGGKATTEKNAVKFTTANPSTVKIWWVEGGDDNRQMAILNAAGEQVAITDVTVAKNAVCISELELADAGTYYLGGATNNNYIFKIEVTETPSGSSKPARADWSKVEAPVLVSAEDQGDGTVLVKVNANVSYDGADAVVVTMTDAQGNVVATKKSSKEGTTAELTFTPSSSGDYTFSAAVVREGEDDKTAEQTLNAAFLLPLTAPVIKSVTSTGKGTATVEWNAVKEATGYEVAVVGSNTVATTEELSLVLTGLTIGSTYTVSVTAVRGTQKSDASTMDVTITEDAQRTWAFSAYGSSTSKSGCGYTGNINDGSVTVYSEGGKGKIVPGSTDGLSFYYTTIDPETENFTLTAHVHVDNWTLSNGQEGFGLMAADAVGVNGDATAFWNNSYQLIASKIEYYWDGEAVTTDTAAAKISMKLGLGYTTKLGVTGEDVAAIKAGTITMPSGFTTETGTLETSCGSLGAGTYNVIGNWTGVEPTGNQENLLTDFVLQIQRNNTGYVMRYLTEDGEVISEKLYYDLERTALTQIDEENIYLGFFASRNARITITDVELVTINPEDDAPAEDREIEYVYPVYTIESANVANSSDYTLVYYGNADGTLNIVNKTTGEVIVENVHVNAATKNSYSTEIELGNTEFEVTFTPDADYVPGEYKLLTSYEPVTFTHTVSFKKFEGSNIYVSQTGTAYGKGTKNSPVDIYTAVKYVQPGQTIILAGGTYNLTSTVKVERGIDGTADNMIYMIADPSATERPVFDFGGNCAGMVLAGDYWYFYGFDVTHSADAQKGVQVSGNYNTLDQINTYENGNTGLQISRLLGTDEFAD
ncbi:MAG: pectinesterase family protein, partial [Lachnospiraceae bacterium]